MPLTIHEILVPSANRFLGSLDKILDKAVAYAKSKEFDAGVLLHSRLAPDMLPLTSQVQIACDITKGAAARLSATEAPKFDDNETTVEEVKARIAKTLAFINGIAADKFAGSEDRAIVLQTRRGDQHFKGFDYLRDFVLPNLYFHVTTTYDILRHNGVPIGKSDFLNA